MISWRSDKVVPLDVKVVAGNESFQERLSNLALSENHFSVFLEKLNEYAKFAIQLRPEFQWVEFKVKGYTLRITAPALLERLNTEEPYDDGYPTF